LVWLEKRIAADMRLFGLIGYPLGHSFSASFFNDKFKKEGIAARYKNFPLAQIAEFPSLLEQEANLIGLNVTVPYKQEIIPYVDVLRPTAAAIQAVNTISIKRAKGKLQIEGDNTDVIGFRRSLEQHLRPHHTNALVLGTGGSSKAIHYVLDQLGISFTRVSRKKGEKQITYGDLERDTLADATLVINTTPLGMHPKVDTFPRIPYEALTPDHLLFDLVYNPEKTTFLKKGESYGAVCVNGYDMLIFQALASWEIWNKTQ
jgi:shikimate dehydrogenase